jgi:long-chain acyl-CoA synthetase
LAHGSKGRRIVEQNRNTISTIAASGFIGCDAAATLPGLFRRRVLGSPEAVAYREYDRDGGRWRDYGWKSIDSRVRRIMAALSRSGLKSGDRMAIALPNGTDWVAFDLAALSLGLVVVPFYLHDSPADMAFNLGHSGARLVVVDSVARWNTVASRIAASAPLQHVWVSENFAAASGKAGTPMPARVIDVVRDEQQEPAAATLAPDSLATIIYTSGTTGQPKGVMLSHHALLWNAEAVSRVILPRPDDVFLSCLPLAHSFERTVGYYLPMMAGSTVAYARSIDDLKEDFLAVRPTAFLGVPRLYERAFAAINERAAGNALKRWALDLAMSAGWRRFEAAQGRGPAPPRWVPLLWAFLDKLVAARVRAVFGGRVRAAVSGGAPLPAEVAQFFLAMGVPIIEGYGLTEAAPVVAANSLDDNVVGSVGCPLRGIEVHTTADRELIVRTPAVMKGYWNDARLSAETLDEHGWLRSGDIAEIRGGRIYILGRLKDIVVLATGEKTAPGQLEERITRNALFKQALCVGEGRPYLCAVVVLDKGEWQALAARHGLDADRPNDDRARELLQQHVAGLLSDSPRHSQVRALYATFETWTVADGLLTPTLKVRRDRLERKYRAEIALLYSGHPVFGHAASSSL